MTILAYSSVRRRCVGIAGLAVAVVGATTVFAQLQASLNRIFGVVATPSNALWGWLRRRVISFGVIFAK